MCLSCFGGRAATGTTIGTDGDGISDSAERNIVGHAGTALHLDTRAGSGDANLVAGAVLVRSDSAAVSVMSLTFNTSSEGTFGQSIPGVPPEDLIGANRTVRVLFLDENTDYRSNLGLANGSERPVTVRYRMYDADGVLLGEGSRDLPAWGNTQVNRILRAFQPQESACGDVWTQTPGGAFTCYGSVLDARTSDPTTVPAG